MTPAKGARAVLYARVSTDEQGASGLGLEAQRTRLAQYANLHNLTVDAEHVEVASAATLDRPLLRQAIADLTPGAVLVALKLDRLTRTARDLDELCRLVEAQGATWATVEGSYDTGTATGRLVIRIIADIAQMEREVTAERTVAALAAKKARGERLGTTPLGYNSDGTKNRTEQATVRMARRLRAEGLTLTAIAERLTAAGRPTKRGGTWHAKTVSLLLRERYLDRLT